MIYLRHISFNTGLSHYDIIEARTGAHAFFQRIMAVASVDADLSGVSFETPQILPPTIIFCLPSVELECTGASTRLCAQTSVPPGTIVRIKDKLSLPSVNEKRIHLHATQHDTCLATAVLLPFAAPTHH